MNQRAACPYCGERVAEEAVMLWDGRTYCRGCVEAVSPALYEFARNGGELKEVVEKSDVSLKKYLRGAGYKTLIVTFVIFMLPFIVLAWLDEPNARFNLLFGVCFFWCGFLVSWLILKGFLMLTRSTLPRTVSVEQNQVVLSHAGDEKRIPLHECLWELKGTYRDNLTAFTGQRKGVVLLTSPGRCICCSHSREMVQYLGAFLILAGVRRKSYWNGLRVLLHSVIGLLIGLLLGYYTGRLVALQVNDPFWVFVLGFLGAVDGFGVGLNYALYSGYGRSAAWDRMHPLVWAGMFFTVGAKFLVMRGIGAMLLAGSINAILGVLAAWSIRRFLAKDDAAEDDALRVRRELQKAFEYDN
ncbi:hypothetical protein Pan153_15540 [Gimesia panareensis]|uniref:Uncharacterized protein n=1 Tax=Gimesia panareensis TaxID=2527978 RepID=A0A518FKT3_9PLAN|nr:hypothetical protein [Gimesia panareensis]QDV16920.1 hypothetical protein Pan153_15540 [Gimesia panareensis]